MNDPNPQQQIVPAPHQEIVLEDKAHKELLQGAEVLYKAVSSTMGPSGHSVIIDNDIGGPTITKDGVTVAKSINLRNRLQSMGAELLKEVASKTNDLAGDGTTTATVLGYNLFREGHKMIATGRSSILLKKGMDLATETVLNFLKDNKIAVKDTSHIVDVGTISANGDKEIGELIASAIDKVGIDGLITVQPAKSVKTTLKLAEGIQLNSGFVSPFFVTNNDKQTCELDNPYVLITSNKISSLGDILPVLEKIDAANRGLLIVADEVEGEALHTLVVNKTKGVIKVCAVKAPSYGENRADILADLGIVVNGTVVGATSEISLKNLQLEHLGQCKRVVVNRNSSTFIVDDRNNDAKERIEARASSIRHSLQNDTTLDDLRIAKYRERLAKLSGGIAVIQVGGSTEVEIREKKDRVEDAVNATQAAAQEGIVPGGGTALFYASQHLQSMINAGFYADQEEDVIAGVKVIANTCEAPFRTIVENTGLSPAVVADKLRHNWSERKMFSVDINSVDKEQIMDFFNALEKEQKDKETDLDKLLEKQREGGSPSKEDYKEPFEIRKFKYGYNAAKHTYGDLVDTGIIDPVKVTRYALSHAVSVIGLTLTCNAVIVNEDIV